MKKMMMVAVMMAVTLGACAQPGNGERQRITKEQMIERRVEMMDKELSLSDKQKKEIKNILTEDMKDMPEGGFGGRRGGPGGPKVDGKAPEKPKADKDKSKADKSKSREEMDKARDSHREEMRARQEATDKKIMSVLNEEQQKKYVEMKKNRPGPGRGHGPGPRGGHGPGAHKMMHHKGHTMRS